MDSSGGDVLIHYGIKGMRWGVRKKKPTSGNESSDYLKVSELRKKSPNEMSNAELQALTQRLQLERQYRDLTTPKTGPNPFKQGQNFVNNVLWVGKAANTAYNLWNSPAADLARKAIAASLKD